MCFRYVASDFGILVLFGTVFCGRGVRLLYLFVVSEYVFGTLSLASEYIFGISMFSVVSGCISGKFSIAAGCVVAMFSVVWDFFSAHFRWSRGLSSVRVF